ncbi:metal-dependent hydrolase [Flavobacteriaceae bacterium 3-367]|uniref:metal-dependent hydrolase n=1 Tax=Eudoraea algarum TaxID=3417568 RepID=UPI003275EDCF
MDSLTQIVLGAAVGEAVLGKKVGNKAMLYGAVAGTIPDLDVLVRYVADTVTTIELHRGFSHSILFSVLAAPILGWLIWKVERKSEASWQDWSRLMFWGLFTHPLLDTFTTWGTQLFWPFDLRLAFQNIFVIDPLYTVPFLLFLLLAMSRKRTDPKRSRWNAMGLWVSSSYLLLTLILKGITYMKFTESLEAQQIPYIAIATRPTPLNSLLWTANVETKDAYLIGDYSLFDSQPIQFRSYPKNHQLLGELQKQDKIQRMIRIAEGWFTISERQNQLYFNDLRFGLLSLDTDETQFVFSYKVIPESEGIRIEETEKYDTDAQRLLGGLWHRIWGN